MIERAIHQPGPLREAVTGLPAYEFHQLAEKRRALQEAGHEIIDFTVGEPREETPEFLRRTLTEAIPKRTSYPPTFGTPALRNAAADWMKRRFQVDVDPETELIATNGSKEALYHVHEVVVSKETQRDLVWVPDPAYPVYATAAQLAGAEVRRLPLEEENGFLPDLASIEKEDWARTSVLWINYPNNPTGARAPISFFDEAAVLARRHGFWLASDEAYVDLYEGEPVPGAAQAGLDNVVVFQTLSKRSAMAGFRSGFLAGDARLVAALKKVRTSQGVATPEFIQAAATAAWSEDAHAETLRQAYSRKRNLLSGVLTDKGAHVAGSEAGFFVYFRPPGAEDAESFAERLLEEGLALVPASRFGETGQGWIRMALVPTEEECGRAAEILRRVL